MICLCLYLYNRISFIVYHTLQYIRSLTHTYTQTFTIHIGHIYSIRLHELKWIKDADQTRTRIWLLTKKQKQKRIRYNCQSSNRLLVFFVGEKNYEHQQRNETEKFEKITNKIRWNIKYESKSEATD